MGMCSDVGIFRDPGHPLQDVVDVIEACDRTEVPFERSEEKKFPTLEETSV